MNAFMVSIYASPPGSVLDGCRRSLGEGVAYRQDKSRDVRLGWGWFCGGFLRISGPLCEVRRASKPSASRFWQFPAVLRTSRGLS